MNDQIRAPKIVRSQGGKPRVPEPHPADYSSPVPDRAYELIDECCDQAVLAGGKPLQRFDW